jgi:hypothetical protein
MSLVVDQNITPAYNPIQPGAYSQVSVAAMQSPLAVPGPVVAVIGTTLGGIPDTAMFFGSAGPVVQLLRGGPAMDCARFALQAGASQVCVVRVGNSVTQGTIVLAGATGTPITLTSRDYGTWCNSIYVTVAANNLVTITYTDALGVVYTETYAVGTGATAAQVAAAINGTAVGFNASNYVTASTGTGTMPLATASSTALTGGTDGTSPVNGDWSNGLTVLETQEVDLLVPATGTVAIHALVEAHCINMSTSLARRERVGVYGGVWGESNATVIARIATMGASSRAELVAPGCIDFNISGALTNYDPFYCAAKLAGMWAGNPDVATSLIHQTFPCAGIERRLSTAPGSDVDTLLAAQVTPIAPQPGGGFWVVDSPSLYPGADQTYLEFHKQRSADYISQTLRSGLELRFVGGKSLNGSASSISAYAQVLLQGLQSSEIIRAWATPQITQGATPQSYLVQCPVMLVDAIKFILITIPLQPASIANTASIQS